MTDKTGPNLRQWVREMLAGGHLGFSAGWLSAKALADLNRAVLSEGNITEIDHPGTQAIGERFAPAGNVQSIPAQTAGAKT